MTNPSDCLKLLSSLGDETDPLLVRLIDRARRADGLFPTCDAIELGPLAAHSSARDLYITGTANDADYAAAHARCLALRTSGNASERELAALSLAVLEASSIIHRRRLLVSESARQADASLAAAAAGLKSEWAKLVHAAMCAVTSNIELGAQMPRCA